MVVASLADQNPYPAIDVLQSISRVMNNVVEKEHKDAAGKIRSLLASYAKNEDLINIGAYQRGADPMTDKAIALMDRINAYLTQFVDDKASYEVSVNELIKLAQS